MILTIKNNHMKPLKNLTMIVLLVIASCGCTSNSGGNSTDSLEGKLPEPKIKGKISLEETLRLRKSVRSFQDKNLSIEQISQLLWAAQGITHNYHERLFRTAPSAGATYPLETYLFTASGIYKYNPVEHSLSRVSNEDKRKALSEASLGQTSVSDVPVVFLLTMIEERTSQRYGERAFRYICMEAGHVAQNIHLQAVALGLSSVPVGAFEDSAVAAVIGCPENEFPLYIVPVGYEKVEE